MAGFNVSFLNPKFKKSSGQDYGFLVDQLKIKENALAVDGKLSPGDYDVLIADTQSLYANPGMSKTNRSDLKVKLSGYEKAKANVQRSDSNDIGRMNSEMKNIKATNSRLLSNRPDIFLEAQSDALKGKLDRLKLAIDDLSVSESDASNHINEFNETLDEYNNTLSALDYAKTNGDSINPNSGFVAYVTTNADGQIVDLKIDKAASKSGYVETNGVYGGFQVYGNLEGQKSEMGKNSFRLGDTVFSAADLMVPDPENPGAMKPNILMDSSHKELMGPGGGMSIGSSGYKNIDLKTVVPQSSIRTGGYAKGNNGFIYKKNEDGSYVKYINADKDKLGIKNSDIIDIPDYMEQSITPYVTQTIDNSNFDPTSYNPQMSGGSYASPTGPAVPAGFSPAGGAPQNQTPAQTQSPVPAQTPMGTPQTGGAPTETAPTKAPGIASKTLGAAKGFLNAVFRGSE